MNKKDIKQPGGYGFIGVKYRDGLLPWFKVLIYKKGVYTVIDRYTGDQAFVGQSIYFYSKKPVFGFNYYGRILTKSFRLKTDHLFDFLKRALRAGVKQKFRGLSGFSEDKFRYYNKYKKSAGFITGEEKIIYNNQVVYKLIYHGGSVEDKRIYKQWLDKLSTPAKLNRDLKHLW